MVGEPKQQSVPPTGTLLELCSATIRHHPLSSSIFHLDLDQKFPTLPPLSGECVCRLHAYKFVIALLDTKSSGKSPCVVTAHRHRFHSPSQSGERKWKFATELLRCSPVSSPHQNGPYSKHIGAVHFAARLLQHVVGPTVGCWSSPQCQCSRSRKDIFWVADGRLVCLLE